MKFIKFLITISIIMFLIANVSFIIVIEYSYLKNKKNIENYLTSLLEIKSFELGKLYISPFRKFILKSCNLIIDNTNYISVSNITFEYNFLSILFSGLSSSDYHLSINNIEANTDVKTLTNLYSKYILSNTNNNKKIYIPEKFKLNLVVKDINLNITYDNIVKTKVSISNLLFSINDTVINILAKFYGFADIPNNIRLIEISTTIDSSIIDLNTFEGETEFKIDRVVLSGFQLMENEKLNIITMSNKIKSIENNLKKYIISIDDNLYEFNYNNNIKLLTSLKDINYLVSLFLKPDIYNLDLKSKFTLNQLLNFECSLTSSDKNEFFNIKYNNLTNNFLINFNIISKKYGTISSDIKSDYVNYYIKSKINASNYGKISLDLVFNTNSFYPDGIINLNPFIPFTNLTFHGKIKLISNRNYSDVIIENTKLNNGYLGRIYTRISFKNNKLNLKAIHPLSHNPPYIIADGFISDKDYNIKLLLKGLPGQTIKTNIQFDIFDYPLLHYYGTIEIYNKNNNPIFISSLKGYHTTNTNEKEEVICNLNFYSNNIFFYNLVFNSKELEYRGSLDLSFDNIMVSNIKLNGNITYKKIYTLPLTGNIDLTMTNVIGRLLLLSNIIRFNYKDNIMDINIKANDFNLTNIGISGYVDGLFNITIDDRLNIKNLSYDLDYTISKIKINSKLLTTYLKDYLNIDLFSINLLGREYSGTGYLKQNNNRLDCNVNLLKNGKFNFSASFEDIYGYLNLDKITLVDFPNKNDIITIKTIIDFKGALFFPDFKGFINIINLNQSNPYTLNIPYIIKINNSINIENLNFLSDIFNIKLEKFSYNPDKDKIYTLLNGNFKYLNYGYLDFKFEYISNNIANEMFYSLSNIRLINKNYDNMEGILSISNNLISIRSYRYNGLNGIVRFDNNSTNFNFIIMNKDIYSEFKGSINNNNLISTFNFKFPSELFMIIGAFESIKGTSEISLNLNGPLNNLNANGYFSIYNTDLNIININTRFRNLNLSLPVDNGKIIFKNIPLKSSTGDFLINGFTDISFYPKFYIDYDINISPLNRKKPPIISLNFNFPSYKMIGNVIVNNINFKGGGDRYDLSGSATVENFLLSISLSYLLERGKGEDNILNYIYWNLPVTIGNNVKFINDLAEVIVKNNNTLLLKGCLGNNTFSLKGDVEIEKGSINYLGKTFNIKSAKAIFYGDEGDMLPYINANTIYKHRDSLFNNIDIYLTFNGKLPSLNLVDFYSVPAKNKDELLNILGFRFNQSSTVSRINTPIVTTNEVVDSEIVSKDTNYKINLTTNITGFDNITYNSLSTLESMLLFNTFSANVRKLLGLDIFNIRTAIMANYLSAYSGLDLLQGSSISIGKYLNNYLFLESDLLIQKNSVLSNIMIIPDISIQLELENINIGYKNKGIIKDSGEVKREHQIELNIQKKF